jgi:tetratricopeptide (TPR) repeat protein
VAEPGDGVQLERLIREGTELLRSGRFEDVLATLDRALQLKVDDLGLLADRITTLVKLGRYAEALTACARLLSLAPGSADVWNLRGTIHDALGRHPEGLADYERALALRPGFPEALSNRAHDLRIFARYDEALEDYGRALEAMPGLAEAWIGRGNLFQECNRDEDALANYRRALELNPDLADAHVNEGFCRLRMGDFKLGWEKHEWRWKVRGLYSGAREFAQPKWQGTENLAGKAILLHAEQGFGDSIQFVRYVPLVAATGAAVFVEVPDELVSLVSGLSGVSRVVTRAQRLPPIDFHCPLLSLPAAFGTALSTIPASVPYLEAPADRVRRWRTRLGQTKKLRIGLAWSGNATHRNDQNRSIALARLAPLLPLPGAEFLSLQKGIRPEDAAVMKDLPITDIAGEFGDFADTAAVVSLVDLVIAVDTSVAHLAGALGRPIWILLPFSADWRWLQSRKDSPWYPTARLFRQPAIGDWEGVIRNVKKELAKLAGTV